MTNYTTYTFYTDTFGGSIIPQNDFVRYSLRASLKVKKAILGKDYTNYNGSNYTANIQYATCSVADILYTNDTASIDGTIKSESIGDYSRTFADNETLNEVTNFNISKTLSDYLWDTGLLNRSIDYV